MQAERVKLFNSRHFEASLILLSVRWYPRYSLSYRDLEEMMAERGRCVDHTTISCGFKIMPLYRFIQRRVQQGMSFWLCETACGRCKDMKQRTNFGKVK